VKGEAPWGGGGSKDALQTLGRPNKKRDRIKGEKNIAGKCQNRNNNKDGGKEGGGEGGLEVTSWKKSETRAMKTPSCEWDQGR